MSNSSALSFIPSIVRGQVTNLLISKLKKENIKSLILVLDESKGEGEKAFQAEFYAENALQKFEEITAKNKALEFKIKFLEKKIKDMEFINLNKLK